MHQTPTHKLSPIQRRAEIVQIFTQAVRRLANPLPNSPKNFENSEKSEEPSLTSLDVSPKLRLPVCNDNTL